MTFGDIVLIILIVLAVIGVGLYFLNQWAYKKMGEQQEIVERTRQNATIFIIDKQRGKIEDANLPKSAMEEVPGYTKRMKLYLVKAKVGPQIVTLITDKNVYNALPVKKNVRVGLAGMYITDMEGMKSAEEMKSIEKAKKKKARDEKMENFKSKFRRKDK